jgi:hypothetical protein
MTSTPTRRAINRRRAGTIAERAVAIAIAIRKVNQ